MGRRDEVGRRDVGGGGMEWMKWGRRDGVGG